MLNIIIEYDIEEEVDSILSSLKKSIRKNNFGKKMENRVTEYSIIIINSKLGTSKKIISRSMKG